MANEIPKAPDLIKEREDLKSKVAATQAQKNRDVENKILGIENSVKQVKDLQEIYNEAKENLDYYNNLNERGELPKDELENFKKAEELVLEIKEKIEEYEKKIKETFTIPEVEGKIMEEAGKINESINEKKRGEEKYKEIKNIISEWLDKLVEEAKNLEEEAKKLDQNYKNSENNLVEILGKEKIDENLLRELKDSLDFGIFSSLEQFKGVLNNYKDKLKFTDFRKKNFINNILKSNELAEYESKSDAFGHFITNNHIDNISIRGCIRALLRNKKEYFEELDKIASFSWEKPYVNLHTVIQDASKDKSVGAREVINEFGYYEKEKTESQKISDL